jgi:predicted nucleic-acid-binding protein
MIAVDTNIVVRFLTQDDPEQYQKSVHLFSTQDIFLADTVMLETEWVLCYAYAYEPAQILLAFRKLCGLPNIHLRDADAIAFALAGYEAGLDFANALHLAQASQCEGMITFDQRFINRARRLNVIPVIAPE